MSPTFSLGTNLSSLRAQRSLSESNNDVSGTFQKLSSGLKITRACDDAAGLCLSEGMKASSQIQKQGIKNLKDGISMLNIADKALSEMANISMRQAELAEQAANGVYSLDQRKALNQEANALVEEYNRVVSTTKFGGKTIFDLSSSTLGFQCGEGTNGHIDFEIGTQVGRNVGDGSFSAPLSP